MMSALARADRLADADLAGPLGDAHQHDVHHADAAHQQADRAEDDHDQRHHRGDAVELLDHLLGGGSRKCVRRVERDAAGQAQHGADLVLRLRHHAGIGDHDQHVLLRAREHLAHREVGKQDARVVLPGQRVRPAGPSRRRSASCVAIHLDPLVDRVHVRAEAASSDPRRSRRPACDGGSPRR